MTEITAVYELAIKVGMPERFINVSKENFTNTRLEIVNKIIKQFTNSNPETYFYLIYGATGIGKSYLAAYIFCCCIYLAKRKEENYFYWTSLIKLHKRIKSTYSDIEYLTEDIDEKSIMNRCCYIPNILVLEFGDIKSEGNLYGGSKSPQLTQTFHDIVDYRWAKRKKTLFVTPLGVKQKPYEQLIKHYDEATVGRLFEDCQLINMTGHDLRLEKFGQRSIWKI